VRLTAVSARPLRLASRGSPLALGQVELVARRLAATGDLRGVEVIAVETRGDRTLDVPIDALDERGVFTNEVDAVVRRDGADAAVHSAKDLPSSLPPDGLEIAAVLSRTEVRDALVGCRLEDLPPGATVATGSPRRRVQIASVRPDLTFVGLRGNIGSRLTRVPEGGALVVALVALERLGLSPPTEVLPISVMLPQVGQGAIALRCRDDDDETRQVLSALDDLASHRAVLAERAFLARLGGGCDAPVAAYATADGADGAVRIEAMIASGDGHVVLKRRLVSDDPVTAGTSVAEQLLFEDGGAAFVEIGS
jgi:hydroxymethylbilane synthase